MPSELLRFSNTHGLLILSEAAHLEGKEWDVVLIETGLSKNGNLYQPEVLKKAVPLFEGLKACAYRFGNQLGDNKFNHLPERAALERPGGFAENVVGWFHNVRYGTFTRPDGKISEGILARFHVLEGAEWLRKNLRDAWTGGHSDILGFSIDARGRAKAGIYIGKKVNIVEEIEEVRSTDVVTEPAAGGAIVRLVASCQLEANMKDIYALLKEHRALWLEGFDAPAEDGMDKFVLNVLEATLAQAQDVAKGIRGNDKMLTEVARGVSALNQAVELIKEGKKDEAMKMVSGFIAENSIPGEGTKEARMTASYAYPIHEATALGDFIKAEADKKGLSDAQLGSAAGISASTVGQITRGEIKRPPDNRLRGFARVLGVSFDRLLNLIPEGMRETCDMKEEDEPTDPEPKPEPEPEKKPDGDPAPDPKPDEGADGGNKPKEGDMTPEEKKKKEEELETREAAVLVKEQVMASDLPAIAQTRITEMFKDRVKLSESDITDAIANEKKYIASLSGGKTPTDVSDAHDDQPSVEVVQEAKEKIDKAWDGFWANEDVDKIPRFNGLREAFVAHNGGIWMAPRKMARLIFQGLKFSLPGFEAESDEDYESHRQFIKESWAPMVVNRYHFKEATDTSSFPVAFGDSLFRRLEMEFRNDPRNDWREVVSSTENLQDATNRFRIQRIGDLEDWPVVAENAAYQELGASLNEENTDLTPSKKGGIFKVSWEAVLADRVGTIRRIPRQLAMSANRTVQKAVFGEIESNVTVAGNALISAGNSTLIGASPAISYVDVLLGIQGMRDQTALDSNEKIGIRPWRLLVGTKLEGAASEITDSDVRRTGGDSTVTNHVGNLGIRTMVSLGVGRTATTDDHWWIIANPREAETIVIGFLGGRDRPDIFVQGMDTPTSGSFFDADTITFKGRLVFGVATPDFRWIQGSLQ